MNNWAPAHRRLCMCHTCRLEFGDFCATLTGYDDEGSLSFVSILAWHL